MNKKENLLKKLNIKFKSDLNKKLNQNPFVTMSKKERGITLIALVVTIVVLIILAVISINAVLGENGLIKQAERGAAFQANAEAEDEAALGIFDQHIANAMAGIGGGSQTPTGTEDWDLNKVTAVTSEDNVTVPVPKGYTASTVEGEKSVANGFVIKEGTDGSLTSGVSEFVWVPVSEMSDMYDATNNAGQLWDFGNFNYDTNIYEIKNPAEKTQNLPEYIYEPNVVTDLPADLKPVNFDNKEYRITPINFEIINVSYGSFCDAQGQNLERAGLSITSTAADFHLQLQNEFSTMIESVEKYGGFYIGRYETGINYVEVDEEEWVEKTVTQKGLDPLSLGGSWYNQYKLNKEIAANENVISSMIWGCQWDATLRWMQTSTVEKVKNFAINSASYGNYKDNSIEYVEEGETKQTTAGTDTIIPTGSSETTKINNIYDMAGNVGDTTIEARDNMVRITRGGACNYNGADWPSGSRGGVIPKDYTENVGSRSSLYIAP